MSKIRLISTCIFILMVLPQLSGAIESKTIYGVTIHLTNNEKMNGYIETYWYLNACNAKKEDRFTWESFLKRQRDDINNERTSVDTVSFINKLIDIKYNNRFHPVAVESSVQNIKVKDIERIDGVCRNWDSYQTTSGVQIITDFMAEYILNHKLIAFYIYDESALAAAGEIPAEDCGLCSCATTYLSYNPAYTQERLVKLRKKIDKMPSDVLNKERLIRFIECFD